MSKQPHLPKVPDELLVSFLHSNRYSRERSKLTIENYFTIRTHLPVVFKNRDPLAEEVRRQMTLVQGPRLIEKDADGNIVWIARLLPGDPSRLDFDVCSKMALMNIDQAIREDPTCSGHMLIADFKGVTMGHVALVKLGTVRALFKYIQDALNLRFKALHVINVSNVVDHCLLLVKPFLSKELASKIHLHRGPIEELYKVVPQEILPKDYGGKLGEMAELHGYTVRTLAMHRKWFLGSEYFVDEAKRQGNSKTASDVFGIDGSFRQLDID